VTGTRGGKLAARHEVELERQASGILVQHAFGAGADLKVV